MIFQTYHNVFTPEECAAIEARAKQEEMTPGRVGGENYDVDGTLKKHLRDSNNYYFSEMWVYEKLQAVIVDANESMSWNLDVRQIEPLQYTEYTGGGFYNWHVDAHGWPYDETTLFPGMLRKISFSVLINDAEEYTGGDFEIDSGWQDSEQKTEIIPIGKQGDMVVFHSLLPHRVHPVSQGLRKSLVGWCVGPPYR